MRILTTPVNQSTFYKRNPARRTSDLALLALSNRPSECRQSAVGQPPDTDRDRPPAPKHRENSPRLDPRLTSVPPPSHLSRPGVWCLSGGHQPTARRGALIPISKIQERPEASLLGNFRTRVPLVPWGSGRLFYPTAFCPVPCTPVSVSFSYLAGLPLRARSLLGRLIVCLQS